MASPSPGCDCESCQYARQRAAEINSVLRCETCGWPVDAAEHVLGCPASRDSRQPEEGTDG